MKAAKSNLLRSFIGHTVLALAVLPMILLSFQNCAPKAFDTGTSAGVENPQDCEPPNPCDVDPESDFALVAHTVRTEINTPKEWTAPNNGDKAKFHISLGLDKDQSTLTTATQGTVEILDSATFKLRYIPAPGYRGSFQIWLYGNNASEKTVSQVQVTIEVGNSLNFFQPVLAVRGSGCVMCHADVRSNIATDLGFGNNFYFGQNVNYLSWRYGAIYGDHQAFENTNPINSTIANGSPGNWAELMHVADKKVYVPANASIPVAEAKTLTSETTVAGYLKNRLAASPYSGTKAANKVVERSTLYIGAPTASRMIAAFNWTSGQGNLVYSKDAVSGAYDLSGIAANGNHYRNSGTVVCEGDVFINSTLYLKDAVIRTRTGCRLYVTGSVFIYGPITYEAVTNSDLRNLQISSAKAVVMGLGDIYKGANHCEAGLTEHNWYYKRIDPSTYAAETAILGTDAKNRHDKAIRDTAYMRLVNFWTNKNSYVRNSSDPVAYGQSVYDEMINTVGLQEDAACRTGGRGVTYSRLLINAPRVESRYNGNFFGSVIAETAVMALGQFKFEFDSVFNNVSILPKLQDTDYLKVE